MNINDFSEERWHCAFGHLKVKFVEIIQNPISHVSDTVMIQN